MSPTKFLVLHGWLGYIIHAVINSDKYTCKIL